MARAYNPHTVAIVLKEAVRRAGVEIRWQRDTYTSAPKAGRAGARDDLVTSADTAAQEIIIKLLRENFPGVGIVAEEHELQEPCTLPGHDVFFTVDPLDGTKALARGEFAGVGSMVALVDGTSVDAAYICDVFGERICGYRPETDHVHIVSKFERVSRLLPGPAPSLREARLLVRNLWASDLCKRMAHASRGEFMESIPGSGSIGLSAMKLWDGLYGAIMLPAGEYEPWDLCPVLGISRKLGYVFAETTCGMLRKVEPIARKTSFKLGTDGVLFLTHESNMDELSAIVARIGHL